MKRGLKLVASWLLVLSVLTGLIPGNLFLNSASAAANELIWPNPGAINLNKKAEPAGKGQWKVTLTVEGKNIQSSSDVVLVIDRSGSMRNSNRMVNAKEAATKFVDNLLIKDSTTRIAVVTFDKTADEKSSFLGFSQKDSLKNRIKGITVSNEGTNIQAGLNKARTMLAGSQAQNKIIVLLSDGAPTYSYKASHAAAYNWPDRKYNFTLYDFEYDGMVLGSGSSYKLSRSQTYSVDGKNVKDNGIAALSEAKMAWDNGVGIYSIGLDVGSDANAIYVLNNVQNKGYYSSNSADLSKVFSELSSQIAYAAQDAIVTDPMGDMFNLIGEPTVSQGTITLDEKTETFTWNVGNIMEGSPATLTYIVEMDQSKNPDPDTAYPTNGTTTIDYTDIHGKDVTKNFEVPQVSFGKGSITVKGYRVNADGQPVNAEGVVVDKPELAEQLYNQKFKQDGKDSLDIDQTYAVSAPTIDGYQLEVGVDPTNVKLTMSEPTPTVWFGFVEAVEQHVTVKYLDKGTNKALAEPAVVKGLKGKQIELEAKKIPGYTPEKASDKYTFTGKDGQEYAFHYTADKQTVTIRYVDQDSKQEIKDATTQDGVTDQEIKLTAPSIDGYTPVKSEVAYKFTADEKQEVVIFYKANEQQVTVQHRVEGTDKELVQPTTHKGHKGEEVNVAEKIPGYTPVTDTETYTFTGDKDQKHTVYYTADKQTVTIRYVDQDSKQEIKGATTQDGVTDQEIKLTAPAIDGYTPVASEVSYKFTADEKQVVTLYYKAIEQQVTVKHVVKGTEKELADPTTHKGHKGEKVNVAKEIEGYTPVEGTETYTFTTDKDQSHTVYYTADKQTVTIRYVDQDTKKEIQLPTTQDGVTDQEIKLTSPAIDGYTPVDPEVEYKFTADEKQVVTLYYKAIEQQVTVKHVVKGTEKELADPTTHKGHKGEKVNVAEEIKGYTPVEGTETYTFTTDKDQSHTVYYTADKQTVTIRYVDQDTKKEIQLPTTQDGVTDQEIKLTAPSIDGYTPVASEVAYKFTADEKQEVVIFYKANEQQVTVQHRVEGTDKELVQPTTHKGHKGEEVNVAEKIPGYTPVTDTETYTFTGDKDQKHTVYYKADKQTVTIRYVDQDSKKEIQVPTTQEGVTDQEIKLTAPSIDGYTPVASEVAYKFTADEKQEVVIYYTADKPAPEMRTIIVKYLEEGTNQQLLEPASLQGEVGKEVLLKAPNIEGYVPAIPEISYPVSSQNNQEYVFYYKKQVSEPEERTVSIHHVDQETNDRIAETTTLTGKVGETLRWSEEPITVVDAVYSPLEINHEYLITDAPEQEYTVYYKKGQDETIVQLLVRFLNKLTNEELGQKTYSGKPDEAITIKPDPITVSGAVYKPEQAEYPYRFTGEVLQELIVYFIPDTAPVEKDQAVTVKYLEQGTGAELAASTVLTGKAGSTVTLTAVPVSGYTPVQSSVVYQFEDKDGQEFIFYYTKNSPVTPPVDPSPSNPGSSSGNSGSVTPLPPAPPVVPPLPPAPPKLDTANHFNYINGYPDGMVKPENNISREEVAAIFYRLMDDATRSDYMKSTSSYKDVAATRWSSKNIATMENAGIITGYPDGTFKPGRSITRAEFAAIASRFDDLDQQENTTFSDIKGHWAEKYIVSAANKGWIKGYPDGTFKPDQYITRAEAMALINSVLNRKVKAEGIHKAAKAWPDNTPNKWYYADVLEATNNHDYSRNADGAETWEQVKPDRVYP